jgi:type II secretory pathway pseudopilin PulG
LYFFSAVKKVFLVHKTLSGVTLIELLFVIAVMGILGTTGILFYQQYTQNQKIDKTINQMEQWGKAGMAYYTRSKKWPASTGELIQSGYMPEESDKLNPWCSGIGCYTVTPPTIGNRFAITAKINAAAGIRDMIAARVPYGISNNSNGTITTTLNVPFAPVQNQEMILVSVLPYQLLGADFTLEQGGVLTTRSTNNISGICLKEKGTNNCADVVPKCAALFGSDYAFESFAVTMAYKADQKGASQQPAFSLFSVNSRAVQTNIFISLSVKPQTYLRGGNIDTKQVESLKDAIDIRGEVFVFCKLLK